MDFILLSLVLKGFAVLRDEIACKPAVIAETDDYVAIASEFQAIWLFTKCKRC